MIADPWFWALALTAVALTGISKGGTGGGAAVAAPLISLAVPPATAAAILLPVLCVMDLAGVRGYFGRWDRRAMRLLVAAGLAGSAAGAATFRYMSDDWIRILVGCIALGFLAWTLWPGKRFVRKPGTAAGWFCGTVAGFTSFITHAGGPPAMVWLIPQKLEKEAFVATSLVFYAALNYAKIAPYLWLGLFDRAILLAALALVPPGVGGIYVGRWLQRRIDTRWFYRIIYVLLFVSGIRLLYDGVTGL